MAKPKRAAPTRGFTYLGLMFVIAVLAMTATMASQVWTFVQQRANEAELAFAGQQISGAIERYRQRQLPAGEGGFPRRLEDLLRDARTLQIERHLRRLYVDPMTGRAQWGLLTLPDGAIIGVHSHSEKTPIRGTLLADRLGFPAASHYRDWHFVAPSAMALLENGNTAETPASASPQNGRGP